MAASEFAIVGAEQKGEIFYESIHELYITKYKPAAAPARPF